MIETKKKITQAQQALEEAEKKREEERAKFDKRPVELKGRGVLSLPDLVIGKSRV